ncbi:MAG: twin-arginine translocase TatA/TatE family subunit [Archangium sp.]|nr:twin-arginine translocase TatA/TatE family subunit [Archangium sp.]
MGLKLPELLLIFFAVMLLFGATRLPQLGSSLGAAIRNFKRGFSGEDEKDPAKKLADGASPEGLTSNDKASSKQG